MSFTLSMFRIKRVVLLHEHFYGHINQGGRWGKEVSNPHYKKRSQSHKHHSYFLHNLWVISARNLFARNCSLLEISETISLKKEKVKLAWEFNSRLLIDRLGQPKHTNLASIHCCDIVFEFVKEIGVWTSVTMPKCLF